MDPEHRWSYPFLHEAGQPPVRRLVILWIEHIGYFPHRAVHSSNRKPVAVDPLRTTIQGSFLFPGTPRVKAR